MPNQTLYSVLTEIGLTICDVGRSSLWGVSSGSELYNSARRIQINDRNYRIPGNACRCPACADSRRAILALPRGDCEEIEFVPVPQDTPFGRQGSLQIEPNGVAYWSTIDAMWPSDDSSHPQMDRDPSQNVHLRADLLRRLRIAECQIRSPSYWGGTTSINWWGRILQAPDAGCDCMQCWRKRSRIINAFASIEDSNRILPNNWIFTFDGMCNRCDCELSDTVPGALSSDCQWLCGKCYGKEFRLCDECCVTIREDMGNSMDVGQFVCNRCLDRLYFDCPVCGDNYSRDDGRVTPNNETYCEECFSQEYFICNECRDSFSRDSTYTIGQDGNYCEVCYDELRQQLPNHDYMPELVFYRAESGADKNTTLFFGFESEIELPDGLNRSDIRNELPPYLFGKSDGSLDHGVEVVSHPATWAWLQNKKKAIDAVFSNIQSQGGRAYNTSTCGFHIHLSRDAFSTLHLYKFLKLFYENPSYVLTISQRGSMNSLDSWAKVIEDSERERITYKAKRKVGGNRYTAVNLTNEKTIEIRIFRGTLSPVGMWKNMEFAKAAFDFTRDSSIRRINTTEFGRYVLQRRGDYPNFRAFLLRKGLVDQQ